MREVDYFEYAVGGKKKLSKYYIADRRRQFFEIFGVHVLHALHVNTVIQRISVVGCSVGG